MTGSGDDDILEKRFYDELGRCLVVQWISDAINKNGNVANRNIGINLDQKCSTGNCPSAILKCTVSDGVPYPCGFVEIPWSELKGEGDGDLSIGADSGISSKEE